MDTDARYTGQDRTAQSSTECRVCTGCTSLSLGQESKECVGPSSAPSRLQLHGAASTIHHPALKAPARTPTRIPTPEPGKRRIRLPNPVAFLESEREREVALYVCMHSFLPSINNVQQYRSNPTHTFEHLHFRRFVQRKSVPKPRPSFNICSRVIVSSALLNPGSQVRKQLRQHSTLNLAPRNNLIALPDKTSSKVICCFAIR